MSRKWHGAFTKRKTASLFIYPACQVREIVVVIHNLLHFDNSHLKQDPAQKHSTKKTL